MTFSLIVCRHPPLDIDPQRCYGRMDVSLRRGWETSLGDFLALLKDEGVRTIYSSPLKRCREVAELCATSLKIKLTVEAALTEMNFGCWEGKKWDEIPRSSLDMWAAHLWDFTPPGGENVRSLVKRVQQFWYVLKQRQENVALITHGGVLRILCAYAEGRPVDPFAPSLKKGEYRMYRFERNKNARNR